MAGRIYRRFLIFIQTADNPGVASVVPHTMSHTKQSDGGLPYICYIANGLSDFRHNFRTSKGDTESRN